VDLLLGLHAPERFRVARIATAFLARRAFNDSHPGTTLGSRYGGGKAGNTAADHDDIRVVHEFLQERATPANVPFPKPDP
jgi:hypothetical protein